MQNLLYSHVKHKLNKANFSLLVMLGNLTNSFNANSYDTRINRINGIILPILTILWQKALLVHNSTYHKGEKSAGVNSSFYSISRKQLNILRLSFSLFFTPVLQPPVLQRFPSGCRHLVYLHQK